MSVDILDVVPDKLEYWAGDTIKGKVILKVKNSFQSQGIFLNFKGGANVELVEQIERSDRKRSIGGTERSTDRMYTNYYPPNSESLLSIGSYVAGDGKTLLNFREGETSYPFSIQLPPQLASSYFRTNGPLPIRWSFIQGTGQVSYFLEVGMMLEGTAGHVSRKVIGIHTQLDLNNVPDASQAGEAEISRTFGNFWSCGCCCGQSGPSTMMLKVKIEKRGYLPGETIPFEVEVKNQSGKVINALSVQVRSHHHSSRSGGKQSRVCRRGCKLEGRACSSSRGRSLSK